MLELYHFSNSICSERVRMVLHQKGIDDWVDHHIDLFKNEQFDPEYVKINPKAETPTLVHDGKVVRESSIICDYLDDIYPEPALKPSDSISVAHMREWIKRSDDQFYEAVASLSFVSVFRKVLNEQGAAGKEKRFRGQTDINRMIRQRSCVEQGFHSEYVVRSVSNMMKLAADMERHLADGREWIMGDQLTLVEANYAPFVARLDALAMWDLFADDAPMLQAWWRRVRALPSFSAAEVGPAAGEEAHFYHACGSAVTSEMVELMMRIKEYAPYDLVLSLGI